MRAIMSPSGSFTPIVRSPSPARLEQAGDQPLRAQIPQRDARKLVLAIVAARPARYLATVADAGRRRVTRHFRELEGGGEPLLHRLGLVARDGSQPRAPARILLAQLASSVVLLDRTLLSHRYLLAFRV